MSNTSVYVGMTLENALSIGKSQKWYSKIDKNADGILSEEEIFNYQKKKKKIKRALIGTSLFVVGAVLTTIAIKAKPLSFVKDNISSNLETLNSISNTTRNEELKQVLNTLSNKSSNDIDELIKLTTIRHSIECNTIMENIKNKVKYCSNIREKLSVQSPEYISESLNSVKINKHEIKKALLCGISGISSIIMGLYNQLKCVHE